MIDELTLGFVALPVAALGIVAASIGAITEGIVVLRERSRQREIKQREEAIELVVEDLNKDLVKVFFPNVPPPRRRHNIHCPTCGRFAKKVWDSEVVVECAKHGVEVRWKDIPADWASKPVAPQIAISPITGPVSIIVRNDARKLTDEFEFSSS